MSTELPQHHKDSGGFLTDFLQHQIIDLAVWIDDVKRNNHAETLQFGREPTALDEVSLASMNNPRLTHHVPLFALFLSSALLLCLLLAGSGPLPVDLLVSRTVQQLVPDSEIFRRVAGRFEWIVWLSLLLIPAGLLLRREGSRAVLVLLGSGSALLVAEKGLKAWVARPRPSPELVRVMVSTSSEFGFPSATTLVATVLFGTLAFFLWRHKTMRWLLLLLPLLVGLSRVAVGAHWFSDIVGSWLFGTAWLVVLITIDMRFNRRHSVDVNPPRVTKQKAQGSHFRS